MAREHHNFWFEKNPARASLHAVRPFVLGAVLSLGPLLCGAIAHATDADPFQLDTSHWMSFDHFKDATARGKIEAPAPLPADGPSNDTPVAQDAAAPVVAVAPIVAEPSRAIDLPVMPGMNKGYAVRVTSTEDEHVQAETIIDSKSAPEIHLPDKNWQDPATAQASAKNADGEDGDAPLDVRLSYLPNTKIMPQPSAEHQSVMTLDHAIVAQREAMAARKKQVDDRKTPAEKAACAAIDQYKKQQLDALQSDRQTLKALQDAISSLGLQKQLDFMANSGGSLDASAPQSGPMNTPAPTSVR